MAKEILATIGTDIDAVAGWIGSYGGEDSPDLRTAIARVHFEVKRSEALRLYAALDQAIQDAGENIPVVLHKQNHRPWVAIVRLDDLPQLAVQLYLTLAENQ